MARLAHLARGLGALVLLAALVAGIPWALWHYVGWPLPHHVPTAAQIGHALDRHGIPARALIDALAVVVWLTWAVLLASVAAEIPAALAGRRARRLPVAGVFQPLTGRLVAAVVVAALALAPRPAPSGPAGSPGAGLVTLRRPVAAFVLTGDSRPAAPHAPPTSPPVADPAPTGSAPPSTPAPGAGSGATRTYVVQRGDTLWGIAERELGDPLDWSQIYALNEGRLQPGGVALTDPHWIDPGWTLLLPPPTTAQPATAQPATATPQRSPSPTAPAPTSPPPTAPATTVAPRDAHRAAPSPAGARPVEAPVQLASGAVIAGSFAAGVLSALAAARLRRRRSYRPGPPRPGVRLVAPDRPKGLHDLLTTLGARRADDDRDVGASTPPAPPPLSVVPEDEAIIRPDLIDVAHREGQVVRLALGNWPGLRLSGPGAQGALRAWLAALVTRDGPYAAEILVPAELGGRLLPGVDLPSVRHHDSVETLLARLEAAAIGRTRRLEDAEVDDAASYRRRSPEDPFPLQLAVVDDVPVTSEARWSAFLATATRLGFAAIVLGPEDDRATSPGSGEPCLVVGGNGRIQHAAPDELAELLAGATAFGLDPGTAADLLAPVAAVHNDTEPEQPVLPVHPVQANLDGGDAADPVVIPGAMPPPAEPDWPMGDTDREPRRGVIRVRLLGPAWVEAWDEEITSGLRASAYALLAWYALHPDGASAEAATDALWPDADPRRGRERFWTALGNLRSRLHGPGKDGVEILAKSGDLYRPDPAVLEVDLWRFETALGDAARAGEPTKVTDALERAAGAYGGDFCPALDAIWVEPVREDLHRRAIDAYLRLAELYAADHPERALGVLERTIELDSICEEAYRRLIALQANLDRRDASRRTWRLLQGRLAELDLDPEEATEHLVHELFSARPATIARLPATRH
ncbi:MAG: BTAD domain-containing putative transcriptional regulator [Acidimicrobiales bacterium]